LIAGKLANFAAKLLLVVVSVVVTLTVINFVILAARHLTGYERMYEFDPLLGWRVLPNLNGARTPYITYTDAHGFRILPNEPRNGRTCEVLLLGDSFAFGSWLSAEDTFAGLLKLNYPQFRIANASSPGYGTDQELLVLDRYAPMLQMGGVVILFTYINDFDDIRQHWNEVRKKPWFDMDEHRLTLQRPESLLNTLLWSAHVLGVIAQLWCLATDEEPRTYGDDLYAARLYRLLIERMAAIVKTRQARFVVLYASGRFAGTAAGRRWAEVARASAIGAGAAFFSLDDYSHASAAQMYIKDDIHWTAAGTQLNYAYLAPKLAPLLSPQTALAGAANAGGPARSQEPDTKPPPQREAAQRGAQAQQHH
jgi:hypothetical protein